METPYVVLNEETGDIVYGNIVEINESDLPPGPYIDFGAAHIPTKAQCEALIAATNQTVCTVLGDDHVSHAVKGMLYTSKDNETKKILLPFAGCRRNDCVNTVGNGSYVWSSSFDTSDTDWAHYLYSYTFGYYNIYYNYRYNGFSVRAVKD